MSVRRDPTEGLFEFEQALDPDLKRMPISVRYKLDLLGLRVSATAWSRLSLATRKQVVQGWPVATPRQRAALREWLLNWLRTTRTEPPREIRVSEPAWNDRCHVPEAVAELTAGCNPPLSLHEWAALELLERVALVKLAQSPPERAQVPTALTEFRERRALKAA